MGPDPAARAAHRLLCGRLAGLLFLIGALASVPVNQLVEPAAPERTHWITLVAALSGAACLVARWDRLPERGMHVIGYVACGEVALTMWGVGPHAHAHLWFLVFIVVFAAYAFEERAAVLRQLAAAGAVAVWPVAFLHGSELHNYLAEAAVAVPILVVATSIVVQLRERLSATADALAAQALTDPLTGLANRRMLDAVLTYELKRHARTGGPLSVVVLDLDGFKHVNDTLGHGAGDRVLIDVAAALRSAVRGGDTVVRTGGDEFCVVAPETDAREAAALIERIRAELRGLIVGGTHARASAGFATFPSDATSAGLLLAEADRREREDKAQGRGRRGMLRVVH